MVKCRPPMLCFPTVRPTLLFLAFLSACALAGPAQPLAQADPRGETSGPPKRIGASERVQVNLVLVDVVVRDRRDRPVSGLSRDDFELLVDRLPANPDDIETFEEICSPVASSSGSQPVDEPPGVTASAAPPSTEPRHIVLYFDFSQLSLSGRRQALRSTRDTLPSRIGPDDEVMIFAYKDGLRLVQDFTSDVDLLISRIDELLASNATHDLDVIEEESNLNDVARLACDPVGTICTARRAAAAAYAAHEEMRARRSLDAIQELMPALEGLDGRKAFILFTDVLREEPGVEYTALARTTPQDEGISLTQEIIQLTREANAAGVSFYTVHASGLDDASTSRFRGARDETQKTDGSDTPDARTETLQAARLGLDGALALQTTLAVETGGRALQRTNDVSRIIETARQDLACYYLLGYRHPSAGDGQRHSLVVRLRHGPDGGSARGLTLRYRPYFTDFSPEDRRERLMRSALAIPDLYRTIPVTTEAFALAPGGNGRRVLVKLSVPLDRLSLLPSGPADLAGSLAVRGEISADGETRCRFDHTLPIAVPRPVGGQPGAGRLVFETGCILEPGSYDMSVAVMDLPSREVGARRAPVAVPAASTGGTAYVSEVHLWTRDPGTLLFAIGAGAVGIKDVQADRAGFIPQAERRLRQDEQAIFTFLLCPAEAALPTSGQPIRIHRTLVGEADAVVAGFKDLILSEPPDPETGCYQIINSIPARSLGDGLYRLNIELIGSTLGPPLTREAAFVVD